MENHKYHCMHYEFFINGKVVNTYLRKERTNKFFHCLELRQALIFFLSLEIVDAKESGSIFDKSSFEHVAMGMNFLSLNIKNIIHINVMKSLTEKPSK